MTFVDFVSDFVDSPNSVKMYR